MSPLAALDKRLAERTQAQILALAVGGVAIVGYADFLTGHELSVGLFYLAPVTLAAWYVGRGPGVAIAVLCSMTWYIAAIDNPYSHPAIPVWNALVRLGFFLICGLLLSALRASLSNAQRLARMDSVTGLFSRRAFMERLEHDLAFMQRRKSALTLVYVDLDDFKAVNDTHGHAAGDRVLRAVGQALRDSTREADTVARLGGDEFALVLPDTDGAGARRAVAKLQDALVGKTDLAVTASIGAVTLDGSRSDAAGILAAGDALMYEAKRAGKRRAVFKVLGGRA
jgi:diguanylate cyclase (GGDEF)-like protein